MKKLHFVPLILLSSFFIFLIYGCFTLLGFGVGAAIDADSGPKEEVVLTGWGEVERLKSNSKVIVTKKNGEIINGSYSHPFLYITESNDSIQTVVLWTKGGRIKTYVEVDSIDYVTIPARKHNGKIIGATIGAVADIAILVNALNSSNGDDRPSPPPPPSDPDDDDTELSCPFIYSFDGEKYRLDGEVFGGAIFQAAQRTDMDNLHYLKETDGLCKLKITNENPETQYVDEMKLLVIDHPLNTKVFPSFDVKIHTASNPQPAIKAVDKDGYDILPQVRSKDNEKWVSYPFGRNPDVLDDARDAVELSFPKPDGARVAKLLLNVQNTMWGSFMQKEMLTMQGDKLEEWYETLNTSESARKELAQLMIREGMLLVQTWTGDQWQPAGFIWEVGPSISKDVATVIDLTNVGTEDLQIRLEFPVGFWEINSVEIDYSAPLEIQVTEVELDQAIDHEGNDLRRSLQDADQSYYVMPTTEYWAELTFKAPPLKSGMQRSFMVKSHGYYVIHMNPEGECQDELIGYIRKTPGAYGQLSLHKLNEKIVSAFTQLRDTTTTNFEQ